MLGFDFTYLLYSESQKKYWRLLSNSESNSVVGKAHLSAVIISNKLPADTQYTEWDSMKTRTLDAKGYTWSFQFADFKKTSSKNSASVLEEIKREAKYRVDTLRSAGRDFKASTVFFEPDDAFVDWLITYANKRVIVDVGCGTGHLIHRLQQRGYNKAVGIDPFFDRENIVKHVNSGGQFYNVDCVEAHDSMFIKLPNVLFIFARPCHSGFVERSARLTDKSSECLYISKLSNDGYDIDYKDHELLVHEGTSVDKEVVYKINKSQL